jgi:hypothetical protein
MTYPSGCHKEDTNAMSKMAYNFLSESFLFREDLISDQYASIGDSEVEAELLRYREHIVGAQADLEAEASDGDSRLAIYFDTINRDRPTVELLKQCALYFDLAVVDDPLFALTALSHPQGEAASQILGYERRALRLDQVADSALFMKSVTPMVAAGFLKFLPFSWRHEPPLQVPIRYSETLFSEGIPPDLRPLFAGQVKVHSLHKSERGWSYRQGDPLVPSRGICVEFQGLPQTFVYHLFTSKAVSFDKEQRTVQMMNWMPDEPPDLGQFQVWVAQSINQAAQQVLRHLLMDLTNAGLLQAYLLTSSPFMGSLLAAHPSATSNLEADLARLSLQVDVPVLMSVTVDDLMRVRSDSGEAFQNFRRHLQRKVRDLRRIEDSSELAGKLEEASHELADLQVQEVAASIQRLKRELAYEGLIAAASIAAILPTAGASLIPLIGVGIKASATLNRYLDEARAHPAYFLWRLKKQVR